MNKTLSVSAIENGTAIDHIIAGQALRIVSLLQLSHDDKQISIGLYQESSAMGRKDLIKLVDRQLSPQEVDRIAILSPNATINLIRNFEVVEKKKVTLPQQIEEVVPCPNPRCISNHEPMPTSFSVRRHAGGVICLQCRYCRKVFTQDDLC